MKSNVFEIKIDEGLSLIIPTLYGAAEIFRLINEDRDHLRFWLPWVDSVTSEDETYQNLTDRVQGFHKKTQAFFYGTLDGKFVASVGFISLNNNEGEIGYWLLSKYQGKGLMTLFVKACVKYGFNKLNLDKIIIKCAEGNHKSAAVPKRLGFVQVDTVESNRIRNSGEQDTLVFTLEIKNWSQ